MHIIAILQNVNNSTFDSRKLNWLTKTTRMPWMMMTLFTRAVVAFSKREPCTIVIEVKLI